MRIRPVIFALLAPIAVVGCSSSSTTNSGTDAGSGSDSAGGVDSGATTLNGCTSFVDHTAAGDARSLTWNLSIATSLDRCTKIKAGQSVTWNGSFATHPLHDDGGDAPNPIKAGPDASGAVAFPTAGQFGFICGVHPSMNGVILVVP